ncbi:class I SAM-dependent methyltransferase [Cupriavidus sp. YAF13]|uniref:class I SAM-dependent methyltransferase n=1 Tax=Cupriavidus sp. YAF13 TaxID=3233075 RepID=UPI003F8F5E3E
MSSIANDPILSAVSTYYSEKLAEHGEGPRGVDWNGEEGQILRFKQLCKVIDGSCQFTLNDLGCGYGALYDFLCNEYGDFSYTGIDVSENMILAAEQRQKGSQNARFVLSGEPDQVADYGIASGIFNVRLDQSDAKWHEYLEMTLDVLNQSSRVGFAFNCLTSYSDSDKTRDYLYYADPCRLFDLCKRRYSRNVALFHDYGLYEFTMIVRK